jgi:hypothetical protein
LGDAGLWTLALTRWVTIRLQRRRYRRAEYADVSDEDLARLVDHG